MDQLSDYYDATPLEPLLAWIEANRPDRFHRLRMPPAAVRLKRRRRRALEQRLRDRRQ